MIELRDTKIFKLDNKGFNMLKKIIVATLISSSFLFAKTFSLEALYSYAEINTPNNQGKLNGTIQDGGLRAIFFTDHFTHEILGRAAFASDVNIKAASEKIAAKYTNWEAEYRFGSRMDNDMAKLGMLSGSAYLGLGYQSLTTKINNIKTTINYIYLPFGFWGEDESGLKNLKIRYGLNLKAIFFDDAKEKFNYNFLLGGKVYAGIGYAIGGAVDIFGQLFFTYNAPIKNYKSYGAEVGLQF